MTSKNFEDVEIFADDWSNPPSDSDIESDSDGSVFETRKRPAKKLDTSESEYNSETSDEEEDTWLDLDKLPTVESFAGDCGLKIVPDVPSSVESVMNLFIGEDFFEMLTYQSNLYYNQNKNKYKLSPKTAKFTEITNVDMKKFLGIILLMGQIKKDQIKDYWSKDPLIETPFFSRIMSRNKFSQMWRAWHFNDNTIQNNDSGRLAKIQPVLEYFKEKFTQVYKPKQQISLDEAMIPWRGRLSFRTYNPGKPNKYGLLVRMLSESDTGYIINLEIYAGIGKKLEETIFSVLQPCLGVWHHVYQDNYYNSVNIAEAMQKKKVRLCGTIRCNRGLPVNFKAKGKLLKKGEFAFTRKGDILLQAWRDKRLVNMISTIHDSTMVHVRQNRNGEDIVKPNCIVDYNKYMKGVDRSDQFLAYCSILRHTKKWSKKVVLFLINCALVNAYKVYKMLNPGKTLKYKSFLKEVARSWVFAECNEQNLSKFNTPTFNVISPNRLSGDMQIHILEAIEENGKKKYPQKPCLVCKANNLRKETRYICGGCKVPLHKGLCFQKYHTKKKY